MLHYVAIPRVLFDGTLETQYVLLPSRPKLFRILSFCASLQTSADAGTRYPSIVVQVDGKNVWNIMNTSVGVVPSDSGLLTMAPGLSPSYSQFFASTIPLPPMGLPVEPNAKASFRLIGGRNGDQLLNGMLVIEEDAPAEDLIPTERLA